jgi:hypothetical protein
MTAACGVAGPVLAQAPSDRHKAPIDVAMIADLIVIRLDLSRNDGSRRAHFPDKSALCVGAPSRGKANLAKDGYGKVKRFDDMAKNAATIQLNIFARRAAKAPPQGSLESQIPRQIVPML